MPKPAKVLWTGGWDSTFRVCQLVLNEQRPVQPIYMLDNRSWRFFELETIDRIWHRVRERSEKPLLLQRVTIYPFSRRSTPEPSLKACYDRLLERHSKLGIQYLKLATIAKELGLDGLELSWARGEIDENVVQALFLDPDENLEQRTESDEAMLFSPFNMPTLRYTKADMRRLAEVSGWLDLMRTTWFCQAPVRGKPCGSCHSCEYAKQSGEPFEVASRTEQMIHKARSSGTRVWRRGRTAASSLLRGRT